jgi:Secretion system C-terminal sorting domain
MKNNQQMKKKLSLAFLLGFSFFANAQYIVYENNFNDDGAEGWILLNQLEFGTTWDLRVAGYYEAFEGASEPIVLSSLGTGGGNNDDWAIMPEQDLSFYTGIQLHFTYFKGVFGAERDDTLLIYAGTTANVADMLAAGPIATVEIEGDNTTEPVIPVDRTVAIPAQYNVEGVYFAIRHTRVLSDPGFDTMIELTNVSIIAEGIAGIDDIVKTGTTLKQNPVSETLELKLDNIVAPEDLKVKIYSIGGLLVKEAGYSEAGIPVSGLATGMYLVTLTDGFATEHLKFIKN